MVKIQASPEVVAKRAEYTSCAIREGIPPEKAKDFAGLTEYGESQLVRAATDQARAAIDTRIATMFVKCAASTVQTQESLQQDARKQFMQEHYQQIAAIQQATEGAVARARVQLGSAAP